MLVVKLFMSTVDSMLLSIARMLSMTSFFCVDGSLSMVRSASRHSRRASKCDVTGVDAHCGLFCCCCC